MRDSGTEGQERRALIVEVHETGFPPSLHPAVPPSFSRRRSAMIVDAVRGMLIVSVGLAAACDAPASHFDRPMIFSVNPVGNGDFVGAPHRGSDFIRYDALIWQRLAEAGGRSARVLASWREIESQPGQWNWSSLDREIDLCERYGVVPVVLMVNVPGWVSPTGEPTHEYPPREENADDFHAFITKLAGRYKGRAKHYEFWNEPNGFGWHVDIVDGKHRYARGDEYLPWLHRAYRAIKAVDPDAQVALGGLDDVEGNAPNFLERCYQLRDERFAGEKCWDAIADHPSNKRPDQSADTAVEKLDAIRAVAARHGDRGIPLWITEYGWNAAETGLQVQAEGTRQFLRRFARHDQADVLIAQQLCVADFELAHLGFGLCDLNLRPRPAFYEFQKLARPDLPQCRDLRYRVHANGDAEVSGTLSAFRESPSRRVHFEIVNEHHDVLHNARISALAFSIRVPDLPRDQPLLARIRCDRPGESVEHPIAHLPLLLPSEGPLPNGGFESLFRSGVPWGWAPRGQAICRDGGTLTPEHVHTGSHALVLILLNEAKPHAFDDRVTIPVAVAKNQRVEIKLSARLFCDSENPGDVGLRPRLVDPEGTSAHRGILLPVQSDWREFGVTLTAPCDAPLLAIDVHSPPLPESKQSPILLAIDDVTVSALSK